MLWMTVEDSRGGEKRQKSEAGEWRHEWRGRSGEDKRRLNVEINSFVNGTELLHSEKTQSDSKILQGYGRSSP